MECHKFPPRLYLPHGRASRDEGDDQMNEKDDEITHPGIVFSNSERWSDQTRSYNSCNRTDAIGTRVAIFID